jgi:hypothetical protein
MIKCEQHNWLYEEFDEPCPLCEVAQTTTDNILALMDEYRKHTMLTGAYAHEALGMLMEEIKNGNLD